MGDDTPQIRALTTDEMALVELYPLPASVEDALVNKGQLAMALDVTETTITAWMRKGLPFEEEGSNGRSYKFRLSIAFAWMARMRADDEAERQAGEMAAHQLQLALLGGESAQPVNGKMTLSDQRRALELETLRRVEARERGELIRRTDVILIFEDVFAAIRDALDALPDRLSRELGIEGRDLERAEKVCDGVLALAKREAEEVLDHE